MYDNNLQVTSVITLRVFIFSTLHKNKKKWKLSCGHMSLILYSIQRQYDQVINQTD